MVSKIKIGFSELNNKVNLYKRTKLKKIILIRNVLLIYGVLSYNITSVVISPIYLLIGAIALMLSFLWTIFILYKTIKFIINYKLECNPKTFVKFLIVGKTVVTSTSSVIVGTIGSTVAIDQFSTVYLGFSPLKGLRRVHIGEISYNELSSEFINKLDEFKSKVKNE